MEAELAAPSTALYSPTSQSRPPAHPSQDTNNSTHRTVEKIKAGMRATRWVTAVAVERKGAKKWPSEENGEKKSPHRAVVAAECL